MRRSLPAMIMSIALLGTIVSVAVALDPADAHAMDGDACEPKVTLVVHDILIAATFIEAGSTISRDDLAIRTVALDDTNAYAFVDPAHVEGRIALIDILEFQPMSDNLLGAVYDDLW